MNDAASTVKGERVETTPPPATATVTTGGDTAGAAPGAGDVKLRVVTGVAERVFGDRPAAVADMSPGFYGGMQNLSSLVWSFAPLTAFSGPSIAIFPVFSAMATSPHVLGFSTTIQTSKVVDRRAVWANVGIPAPRVGAADDGEQDGIASRPE